MLRPLIFALSRSRLAAHVAANVPGFRGFSKRFVAGTTQGDVIEVVRRLNARGPARLIACSGDKAGADPVGRSTNARDYTCAFRMRYVDVIARTRDGHPLTREEMVFAAGLPSDMHSLLKSLESYRSLREE